MQSIRTRQLRADLATMAREMTQFTLVRAPITTNPVSGDVIHLDSAFNLGQADAVNAIDFTWDQHHHGGALHQNPVAAIRGRFAYVNNAKQIWGTWNRAYILDIPNARQIHINQTVLLFMMLKMQSHIELILLNLIHLLYLKLFFVII